MLDPATLPALDPAEMVDISVIVPTYNEEKYLPHLLASLRRQRTRFNYEVIVTDDGSTDRTVEIAREFGARVIPNTDKLDVVEMRNLGFRHSRGRTILFTDADTAYSPNFLQRMAEPILRPGSEYDMTQGMWQVPLERVARIVPGRPVSRSYVWWLRYGPLPLVGRARLRVIRWLRQWAASGFRRPLLEIGDRGRTGFVLARRELVIAVGGRRGQFGAQEDVVFATDCLRHARKTRWILGVTLYSSVRRTMPERGIGWAFRPLWHHLTFFRRYGRAARQQRERELHQRLQAYREDRGPR